MEVQAEYLGSLSAPKELWAAEKIEVDDDDEEEEEIISFDASPMSQLRIILLLQDEASNFLSELETGKKGLTGGGDERNVSVLLQALRGLHLGGEASSSHDGSRRHK